MKRSKFFKLVSLKTIWVPALHLTQHACVCHPCFRFHQMCKVAECKPEAESANSSFVYWLLCVTLCVYLRNSVANHRDLKQGTSKHAVNPWVVQLPCRGAKTVGGQKKKTTKKMKSVTPDNTMWVTFNPFHKMLPVNNHHTKLWALC